jgi:hypothetical protein
MRKKMSFCYKISRASGRGECRVCNTFIGKGLLNVKIYDGKFGHLYHIDCIKEALIKSCKEFENNENELKGLTLKEKLQPYFTRV